MNYLATINNVESDNEQLRILEENHVESNESQRICNCIVKASVKKSGKKYFENIWLPSTFDILSNWKGFRHRNVIPPSEAISSLATDDYVLKYIIILYFDGPENVKSWLVSEERHNWINDASNEGVIIENWIDEYGGSNVKDQISEPTRIAFHNTVQSPPQVRPPPKWKLFLLFNIGACSAMLASSHAGVMKKMEALEFSSGLTMFFTLCHVIFILIYGFTPMMMAIPWINTWLRSPRPEAEDMPAFQKILDQGLDIFTAITSTRDNPNKELLNRLDKLEGRMERLRQLNHELSRQLKSYPPPPPTSIVVEKESQQLFNSTNFMTTTDSDYQKSDNLYSQIKRSSCGDTSTSCHLLKFSDPVFKATLTFKNNNSNINISKSYNNSNQSNNNNTSTNNNSSSNSNNGITVITSNQDLSPDKNNSAGQILQNNSITTATTTNILNDALATPLTMVVFHYVKWEKTLAYEDWVRDFTSLLQRFDGFLGLVSIPPQRDGEPYVISFTFESYADLQTFTDSTDRLRLMRLLEPVLEGTTIAQITQERVLHDALSELFVSAGGVAPSRPPPVWKTYILSLVSMQIIAWPNNANVIPFLTNHLINRELAIAMVTTLNVFCSAYLGQPLLQHLFGGWLKIPRPVELKQPWKSLDSGLLLWQRILLCSFYFGCLLIAGFF